MNIDKLVKTYVLIDDFLKDFMPYLDQYALSSRSNPTRGCLLSLSQIMTIVVLFHVEGYRNFKSYYQHILQFHSNEFRTLVSYNRFIEFIPRTCLPLYFFIHSPPKTATGCYFVDSTILKVCHVKRAHNHKVFKGLASKSKTTTGWFFGLKLHMVINDLGEVMNFQLTTGKTDDRVPVPDLLKKLSGKVFADKGYINKELFESLMEQGIQLITNIKKT